eukprot:maker-scaffold10_size831480-snap-gene-7.20 protein:Tk01839 transcript:maker-scaffold10_size831480-snap-gene-7.20-mRNA-1 annotation:"tetratricopeptide repeat protein 1"
MDSAQDPAAADRDIQASLNQESDGSEGHFQDAQDKLDDFDEFHDAVREGEADKLKRPEIPEDSPAAEDEREAADKLRQERENQMTDQEREENQNQALELKKSGNEFFLAGANEEAVEKYSEALDLCPLCFSEDRAVLYGNRAAARMRMGQFEAVVEDCSDSIRLKPDYMKALVRRAQAYEESDKPHEAMKDFEKILEIDPQHAPANVAVKVRLPEKIKLKDEQMKTEMMTNLKKLGNMVLNPFGLSTENFQFVQDPQSGNYSMNFSQNTASSFGHMMACVMGWRRQCELVISES